jgi:3-deoxy-D-manno-octulosonate 8-phosphate phosphatase (KDO 8-P phosphatase)
MASINVLELFEKVKICIFDIDGVLTDGSVHVTTEGDQLRTFNIKDGYAMVKARESGLPIAIISAGQNEGARKRMEYLGVEHVFLAVKNKIQVLETLLAKLNLNFEDVLYMGDDIPDVKILKKVGLPTCPADAADDVFQFCKYISPKNGGRGAVRDVLEKTLKVQGKWLV